MKIKQTQTSEDSKQMSLLSAREIWIKSQKESLSKDQTKTLLIKNGIIVPKKRE